MTQGRLYIIPNFIGDTDPAHQFPVFNSEIIQSLKFFFVENPKPARALIKALNKNVHFDETGLFHFDKHSKDNSEAYEAALACLKNGNDVGILSDAGCPGIADPGSELVKWAHDKNIEVVPLIGPSSIFLTLMASGLNGQHFSFMGYLPKDSNERVHFIKKLGADIRNSGMTCLFIETPYKTESTFKDLISYVGGSTRLCLGIDLFSQHQTIICKTIDSWKAMKTLPKLKNRQVVFAIGIN